MQRRSLGVWGAVAVLGTVCAAAPGKQAWQAPPGTLAAWHVGPWRVVLQPSEVPGEQRLTVALDDEVRLDLHGVSFGLAPLRANGALGRVLPGDDIDGDSVPDLAISEWTGGGHASHVIRVYRLGEDLELLAEARASHDEVAYFEDVDGDHRLELRTHDWTFANWRSAFAFAPAPEVVLSFQEGRLRPDWRLTGSEQPSASEQALTFRDDPAWAEGEVPPALWGAMLDALYAGRAQHAWRLLEEAWPEDRPGRDAFRSEFLRQLAKSPFWHDLAPRIG